MSRLSVLLIGDDRRREFRDALEWLGPRAEVHAAQNVNAAVELLADGQRVIDLIVPAHIWPGQFSAADLDRLRPLAPLARIAGVLGTWCEGETRTGHAWPGAIRAYWHQWTARMAEEFDRIAAGRCPTWGLPVTSTDEERYLACADDPHPRSAGLIAIHTRHFDTAEALADACQGRGYSTVWYQPGQPISASGAIAALWSGRLDNARGLAWLADLANQHRSVPIIALVDFPRHADCDSARAAGAAAVISKPYSLDDLFWTIDRVTADCG